MTTPSSFHALTAPGSLRARQLRVNIYRKLNSELQPALLPSALVAECGGSQRIATLPAEPKVREN